MTDRRSEPNLSPEGAYTIERMVHSAAERVARQRLGSSASDWVIETAGRDSVEEALRVLGGDYSSFELYMAANVQPMPITMEGPTARALGVETETDRRIGAGLHLIRVVESLAGVSESESKDGSGSASIIDWPDLRGTAGHSVKAEIEALIVGWRLITASAEVNFETKEVGDVIALMLSQLINKSDPPAGVIAEAAKWFLHKADVFAEEFAKTAGKTAAAGAGVGVAASFPAIRRSAEAILTALGA